MRHELDRDRAQAGTVEHPSPATLRAARELAESLWLSERQERQTLAADARADEELHRIRRAASARTDEEWNELYDAACHG